MNVLSFSQVLLWGFFAPSFVPTDLAMIAYRLRLEVARALLARWQREGWEGLTLIGDGHVAPVRPPPDAGYPVWSLRSAEARQLVVASLAAGHVYRDATDPVGSGPGFEKRLRVLREALGNIDAARAAVT